jgi:hypothetical protein
MTEENKVAIVAILTGTSFALSGLALIGALILTYLYNV